MSELLAKAIAEVQAATIELDLAQTDYERFATFEHPAAQIAYATRKKPALMRAEHRLVVACKLLKASGWVRPHGLLAPPAECGSGSPGHTCG